MIIINGRLWRPKRLFRRHLKRRSGDSLCAIIRKDKNSLRKLQATPVELKDRESPISWSPLATHKAFPNVLNKSFGCHCFDMAQAMNACVYRKPRRTS